MEERRRMQLLADGDIERIAEAVSIKTKATFHIEDEKHYNDHQRLDRLLTAYEEATTTLRKTLIGLIIVGAIVLAGIGASKGMK